MSDADERPRMGTMPKVIIGLLAAFGLITLISWAMSLVFGLARLLILVAVVVVIVLWVTGRGRTHDD